MLKRFSVILVILLILSTTGAAQIPRQITYQGVLLGSDEQPVAEGQYKLTFKIYNEAGTELWSEVHNQVWIGGGLFQVFLGSVNPINLTFNVPYFLGIQVDSDQELEPRMLLSSVPYSIRADDANTVSGFRASDTPGAGVLLPLGSDGKFPSSVLPSTVSGNYLRKNDADTSRITGSSPVILISNLGTGDGINGRGIDGVGMAGRSDKNDGVSGWTGESSKSGVYGHSTDGRGVVGRSDNNDGVVGWTDTSEKSGVYGHTNDGDAYGVFGRNHLTNSVGYLGGDHGVYGKATGVYHAGHFEAAGGLNTAVYGQTTGDVSYAGFFLASGNYSYGIYAEGPSTDKNGCAALFKGNVELRSRDTDVTVLELGEGLDYAEGFNVTKSEEITAGSVLIIDSNKPGKLALSKHPYDKKVAGIVAGANGLGSGVRLGAGQFDHNVALAGRVYCNVDATYGEIAPGDLLTTSSTPGYAMIVKDHQKAQGAILGKAMQPLKFGTKGQILVLVTLQ